MGNCSARMKPIKLIGSQGELKLIPAPVTAAELILDSPGYAVAPVDALRLTRRVTASKAEEELAPGKAYLLVPVDRVGSRVSNRQLAAIEGATRRRRMSGSKVLPEALKDGADCEGVVCSGGGRMGCQRRRNGRPWSPVLEPILETGFGIEA